jgi:regulator of protease activity HflC (stomatin/prohibitin superfamily)
MAENKKTVKDPRVTDIETLKKNFERWRKFSFQSLPVGVLMVFISILFRMPFIWHFLLDVLGCAPFVAFYITHSLKIVRQWEVGVVFRKGGKPREIYPGKWNFLLWPIDNVKFVDVNARRINPTGKVVWVTEKTGEFEANGTPKTRQVPITVDPVFWIKVTDPVDSIVNVEELDNSIIDVYMGRLQDQCTGKDLEYVNAHKTDFLKLVEDATNSVIEKNKWGVKVFDGQIQDLTLPPDMAESQKASFNASRRREAAIIDAETKALEMGILDKADPDMRRRILQALVGFKGDIHVYGRDVAEIIQNLLGGTRK